VIIGTAGHIDHGKTALVKALTGVDTDRLPEEKRRGITVELGFAPINLGGGIVGSVIDVPGHEAFVKTMVAGSAGVDVALLVVAADEGLMPQTREHLAILDLLEIPELIVALTKTDLVDSDWLALVEEEVSAELSISRWPTATIVPCSTVTGAGLEELRSALAAVAPPAERGSASDLFRLPVDRCFTMKGTGTVVTGTVWSGDLASDASVRILPGDLIARVRQLHRHGSAVSSVHPGERAAVALVGVEVGDIPRGSSLVSDASWQPSIAIDAWVTMLGEQGELDSRSELRLHLAGADVGACAISPDAHTAAARGRFVRLKLEAPVVPRGGDRFILRLPAPVGTIGGGVVLDPFPRRRTVTASAALFRSAAVHDAAGRFAALLGGSGIEGVPVVPLSVRLGATPAGVNEIISDAGCVLAADRAFAADALGEAKAAIIDGLAEWEQTLSLEAGVQYESVIAFTRSHRDLARLAVTELERDGWVKLDQALVRRAGWQPSLTAAREKIVESVVHAICSGGSEPPSAGELAERYGGDVLVLLRYLEREGRVIQVSADRFYAREAVNGLIEKLRRSLVVGTEYGPSQLREALGFSRKYLIPFLEFCDRSGVTERKGDGRSLKTVSESLTQM
jgi:selenocysteine-specific elongation factor